MIGQLEGQRTGEILDRRDLGEDLLETPLQEPGERLMLDGEEIG